MTDHVNPFASPLAEESPRSFAPTAQATGGLWTEDGVLLKAIEGAQFPDRCVKCNAPAEGFQLNKTYSWHPRWIFLLLLLNVLIYILAALGTRRQMKLAVGLCPQHRSQRRNAILLTSLLCLGGFLGVFFSLAAEQLELMFGCVAVMVVGALIGILRAQVLTPTHIDRRLATLKGAGPEFLASIAS